MRPVLLLARLNEIELTMDALRARWGEIAEALNEPAELQSARAMLAKAETELAGCRVLQQEREATQRKAADRLAQAENDLYGGQMRSPKELENAERDVGQLRRQRDQAEDELLETLIAFDTVSEIVAERQAEFARLTAEWEATQMRLHNEQVLVRQRLLSEQSHQLAARRAVPADLLALYDGLRARKGGRAVAELDEDICTACRVAAPPGKLEIARFGEELVYCDNCGRLLWGE
jgi:predicted  nucleic acid-binding Zn-ribbon protein